MKNHLGKRVVPLVTLAISMAAATLALSTEPADSQATATGRGEEAQQPDLQANQTRPLQKLSAADDFKGIEVKDPEGREIGTVTNVLVETGEGKVAYLVLSASPEAGGEQVIVPWKAVQTHPAVGTEQARESDWFLVLNVQQDQLRQAPQGDVQAVFDREQERQIHQFYGVSPYWEEDQERPMPEQPLPPGHPSVAPPVLPPGHPPVLPPGHPPVTPEGQQ